MWGRKVALALSSVRESFLISTQHWVMSFVVFSAYLVSCEDLFAFNAGIKEIRMYFAVFQLQQLSYIYFEYRCRVDMILLILLQFCGYASWHT